ncbi:alkaline phosphatase-like protein [Lophiostoma macrostomum CBS 122681]|uniref:Alkaline phosphatase-like protein n=1 Tax=Lophiostoma macrostomum CBS 122681 TaxID=1314788 RepID=A0A6A6TV89_9PLEO|nr:alkaline phosphatase-like protein [Lophiostoma macrostomum CBS 122681]
MAAKRPNFLIILADDLGFSDIGCFGGEIQTPNLDKLAEQGLRFTDFHAAAACSPSRAMLMTGTDHHIAGLGNLIEWTNISGQNDPSGKMSTAPQRGMPGYEGYLNERVATVSEVLRDAGYATLLSGKWHLGLTPERSPKARGFEKSFAHLPACSNHYAYEPSLDKAAGDAIPDFMTMSFIALHSENGEYVRRLPSDWYSSNGYGTKLIEYLREWKSENEFLTADDSKPFFAYLPFTAPHWPLQAPQEHIRKYRGVYDDGPDALRSKRLQRLIDLGMIPQDTTPHPVVADEVKSWNEMSPFEQSMSARAMECFAGMVDCIDYNVGRVIQHLKDIDEYENTFICFMSDNGAEGAAYEAYPIVQGQMMQHLQKYYDNNLDNLGNGNSFVWYGPRWAQAATAPSRLFKAYTTEGGVRVPFLAKWPKDLLREEREGGITDTFSTIMDIMPSLLDMAGVRHPAPTYQGREIVEMRGKSMMPFVKSSAPRIHEQEFVQGWETCGRAAVRKSDWKIVFIPKPKGIEKWQLYNLRSDPGEVFDLAEEKPEILKDLLKLWEVYVLETGVVPLAPELGKWMQMCEEQMKEDDWIEYEYWKEGARDDPEKYFKKPWRYQGQTTVRQI